MTELMGHTQTASYMTAPRLRPGCTGTTFLPSISVTQQSYGHPYDTYPCPPIPGSVRRHMTAMPWRPSTYYGGTSASHTASHCQPQTTCVPDPVSDRNRLIELDSMKVRYCDLCNSNIS
jgi:hypothetical protein